MRATLRLLAPRLAAGGYVGYINLNTIVNERGVWPLELTTRFGYPGYAILSELQAMGWGELFQAMVTRSGARLAVRPGYAVGVVLTVPPFPYSADYNRLSRGAPIVLDATLTPAERARLHYAEVAMQEGQLVTSGTVGYVAVATGVGGTVPLAQRAAYDLARRVHVPNVRYRTDIGDRFVREDEATLQALGWLTTGEAMGATMGGVAPAPRRATARVVDDDHADRLIRPDRRGDPRNRG
jgi:phosphoribosylamine--glycine ligase